MAHIERIVQTYPIEGADNLEMAQVLDYHVAVKKGEFKANDKALYIEIDSIVPDGLPEEHKAEITELGKRFFNTSGEERDAVKARMAELGSFNLVPQFEFLRSRGFKIKQVYFGKLKIYSQGILFSLSTFPVLNDPPIGFDATDILNIKQIIEDPDEAGVSNEQHAISKFMENNLLGKIIDKKAMRYKWYRQFKKSLRQPKGVWHDYFPSKSDEENIQKLFTKMKANHGDKTWYVTEKLEGQNIAVVNRTKKILKFFKKNEFGVCSHHRFMPVYDGSGFWKTVKRLGYKDKISKISGDWFIRGEHTGAKIQGGIYGFPETDIHLFDVYDINNKRMLPYEEMKSFIDTHGFKMVPVIDDNFKLPETVGELLEYSNGYSVFGTKVHREGVIIRLKDDPTVSFKVKSPVYLNNQEKKPKKESK